ncbi:transcriptional regulator [Actinomadura craniellae]|uniref:Transcriptional regulator n=1 Tax=Actinomadura craniellae TaxID=2231787 RepID=A0A365HD26_9ACTN|nr:helix-turn-helix transcriptional regulator [Actinomadura craniellae]RAY17011.1 transcriptional regulator [Actinomadura craniellae]
MSEIQAVGYSPTIKKRALSRKLVAARKQVGLTTTQVCKEFKWSPTKLNYIEKAKWIEPNSDVVADLCELYGIEGQDREALIQLARGAGERGWWTRYNDVFRNEYPGFETSASAVMTYQNMFLPGLLQVEEYIEEVTRAAGIEDPAEIKRHVAARLERQKILSRTESPARLHAIIDENTILRIKDPGIRVPQLRHLVTATEHSNMEIQILPVDAGLYPGAGGVFTYLRFADPAERDIVFLETTVDDRMLEEKDELQRYMVRFGQLREVALDREASRAYLMERIE